MLRTILRINLAVVMMAMGVLHFTADYLFVQIMPPFLPWHYGLVWISGVFEALLGVALLIPKYRRVASYGLVALFVAVFPANIYMAAANVQMTDLPPWLHQPSQLGLWLRLPLQALFIWWALRVGRDDAPPSGEMARGFV